MMTTTDRSSAGTHASRKWHRRVATILRVVLAPVPRARRIALWVLGAALIGALGVFGGTAYAYYTASGSGTAQGAVTSVKSVIVTTATPASTLLPGGTADLALSVTNPNPFPVTLTGLSASIGTVTVTGTAACTSADATVAVVAQTGLDVLLTPGPNTVDIATAATMGPSSASACQHASFAIPVKLTVKQ